MIGEDKLTEHAISNQKTLFQCRLFTPTYCTKSMTLAPGLKHSDWLKTFEQPIRMLRMSVGQIYAVVFFVIKSCSNLLLVY